MNFTKTNKKKRIGFYLSFLGLLIAFSSAILDFTTNNSELPTLGIIIAWLFIATGHIIMIMGFLEKSSK